MIGRTLGKYRIVEQVGRGGLAEVYKAYDFDLDRYVAIKTTHSFLADDPHFVARFQREARSLASLNHPNIVQAFDFGIEANVAYLVMRFIAGLSLKNKLIELKSQKQWFTLEEVVCIVRDTGEALDYAHRQGMLHRDIKPDNIMLSDNGDTLLTDFGLAKMLSGATKLTASGAMIGTPGYMSPEQAKGEEVDARSDIYSLGIVFFEMVTSHQPFSADTPAAVLLKHINAPLPVPSLVNPGVPDEIDRVILKAAAKAPENRYQTVREMLVHLDQVMPRGNVPKCDLSSAVVGQSLPGASTLTKDNAAQPIREAPVTRRGIDTAFSAIGDAFERRTAKAHEREYLVNLHQTLISRFDRGELVTLCFHLDIDYDDLPGEAKTERVLGLIRFLNRRERIPELIEAGKKLRPDIPWDEI